MVTRFDVCEAFHVYRTYWHRNGATERCHRQGRYIDEQLHRMHFKPSPLIDGPRDLTPEGREVYDRLTERYHGVKRSHHEWVHLHNGASPGCAECGLEDLHDYDDDPERVDAATVTDEFSRSRCDLCNMPQHGTRYAAHGQFEDDNSWTHLRVCEDCRFDIEGY